ncbi:MAG TPA: BatA domain-containing protein [Candidatus Acidoferrales bacterium]|nr:BatA domain-containing protein [Candidatus Acidoferrales bacterium]
MGFLAPWFLAGAAAVSVPLYLHLLRRHTTTPHPFSSLMFFERRTQSSIRHRRLRYILLLSLRAAVLLSLALAFANPYVSRPVASASGEKLLVLAIDNSFSMRAGSRLADAKREAISVLDGRNPAQRAQILALGSEVHVLTQPEQDSSALRAAVQSVEAGDSRGSFGELARAVNGMAASVHTPIELHLFSDMQKSDMPASFAELALPSNVSLVLHPVVKAAVPNWTVESVNAPGQIWDPKKSRVEAVVAGYDTPAGTRNVSLIVNGKTVSTRSVDVPAAGRATVEFSALDAPYGFSRCEVRIDSDDSLRADDGYMFAVERSDPQRVLFVHQSSDSRSPTYFGAALTAAAESAFQLDSESVERAAGLQLSPYAFVVLSDVPSLPSSFENELLQYVSGGGSLLIAAGASSARRSSVPVIGNKILNSHDYSRDGARFLSASEVDPSHPSVAKAGRWQGVKFYYAVLVDAADSRVIARLSDQTPLLLEKKIGEGRALLLTSGLDNLTNDFPLHPIFLPFVEETALYLSGTERRSGSRLVDTFLELRTAKEQAVSVEVIDPAGRKPFSLKEATSAQSYQLTQAGFYQLRLANGRQDVIGVNADRRESDLAVMPPDMLALWTGRTHEQAPQTSASGAGTAREEARPYSLWWYAMLTLLAVEVAESLLASRYLGMQGDDT